MSIDAILAQLASMKDNSKSFIDKTDPEADAIWAADVAACEAATDILTALQDEGIKDPEQVRDLFHDYNALAEQYRKMHQRYEEPAQVLRLGGGARAALILFGIILISLLIPFFGEVKIGELTFSQKETDKGDKNA